MLLGVLLTLLVACFPAVQVYGFIDVIPTLGRLIADSRLIVVLRVEKVDRQKRIILFRTIDTLSNPDRVAVPDKIRHRIGADLHPHEAKRVLDAAQPGEIAVCLASGRVAVTCLGGEWYELNSVDPSSWMMTRNRGELSLAYAGTAESLRTHVADILAGKEVIVTAVRQIDRDFRPGEAIAFKQGLRGRDMPLWRIRASLNGPSSLGEQLESSRWVVGIGAGDAADVPPLLAQLKSGDPQRRAAGAAALGLIGRPARPAMPALLAAMHDPDEKVAVNAAACALRIDPKNEQAAAALREQFRSHDAVIRRAAAAACGDLGRQAAIAVDQLVAAVDDPDSDVRVAAVESLGQCRDAAEIALPTLVRALDNDELRPIAIDAVGVMGPAAKAAAPQLVRLLDDPDKSVQWAAALSLLRVDNQAAGGAIPLFLSALRSPNARSRWDAVWYFERVHDPAAALDDLLKLIAEGDTDVRVSALLVVGNIGEEAARAMPAITRCLNDPVPAVRNNAARALALMRIDDLSLAKRAAKVLADLFSQTDPRQPDFVLWETTYYLKKLGPVESIAVPTLSELTSHADAGVRRAALAAIASFGDEAQDARPAVAKRLSDPDQSVRTAAAKTLWEITGDPGLAVPAWIDLIRVGDAAVRVPAAEQLALIGPRARAAIPSLLPLLDDHDPLVQLTVAEAILAIDRDPAPITPRFLAALVNADPSIRRRGAVGLGKLGPSDADMAGELEPLLDDPDVRVRIAAASALNLIGAKTNKAVGILAAALDDADDAVRADALETLGHYRSSAGPLLPQLRAILSEEDSEIQFAAASAILRITGSDHESLDLIIALLPDGGVPLRIRAVQFLGEMGQSAQKALPALRNLCNDHNDDLAAAAKDAVAKLTVAKSAAASTIAVEQSSDRDSSDRKPLIEWKWLAALAGVLFVAVLGVRLLIRPWRS
jgi:HEAT repeat protein